ncbi:MAG: hypothetical protein A3D28_01050 [Omnitrophica bacterium RIFCSPHIGHO2_02_FULL_63_14]|nr:MAG: hypothetical protein A3D28_01050 [Omnitrophica bacterium RIFCSPHIGHO2_02_FULL_63_14]
MVPFLPVIGFTLPFALQLSALVWFGLVRTWGARYVPVFVVLPRTLTGRAKAGVASTITTSTATIHLIGNLRPMDF